MTFAQVTRETRLLLKVSAIVCVTLFFLFILVQGGIVVKSILFPTPPPPPEEKFGKLPSLGFNSSPLNIDQNNINTVNGTLPSFPDQMLVYKIIQPQTDINALVDAETKMSSFGFTSGEQQIAGSETLYKWTNPTIPADIQYDIVSNNFTISSSVLANPNVAEFSPLPDPSSLPGSIHDILSNIPEDVSDTDITNANSTVTLYKIVGTQLVQVTDPTQAQVAVVNLVQSNIPIIPFTQTGITTPVSTLPIFYSKPNEANIHFTTVSINNSLELISGHYIHYVVDQNTHSTYPIKTSQQAFDDLKNGKAAVFYQGSGQTIQITAVNLAFYMGQDSPQYLEPIYVFTGENGFTAYVQAVSDSSIGN